VSYNGAQTVSGTWSAAVFGQQTLFASYTNQQIRGGLALTQSYPLAMTPGAAFRAETSQTAGAAGMDTYMRARNSANVQFALDDDSGAGAYSLFNSTVPADGNLTIDVTRFGNSTFSAAASTAAAEFFDLNIFQASIISRGVSVQWYRFTGLSGLLEAQVLSSTGFTDTMLAAFDSAGNVIGSNDDFGSSLLSAITAADNVAIPGDGVVFLAVTNYRSGALDSSASSYINNDTSAVNGTMQLSVIPTPAAAALLGLGGLAAARRRRA
jgi:hypothetical protein